MADESIRRNGFDVKIHKGNELFHAGIKGNTKTMSMVYTGTGKTLDEAAEKCIGNLKERLWILCQ